MGYESLIVGRHLRPLRGGSSLTSLVAAVGVSLGVAALVIVLSVMNGYTERIFGSLLGMNAHMTVRRPYSREIEEAGTVRRMLEAHPDVVGVLPYIRSEGFVLKTGNLEGSEHTGVVVRGVDRDALTVVCEVESHLIRGAVDLGGTKSSGVRKTYGMLIGSGLAGKVNANVGDDVYLGLVPRDVRRSGMPRWRKYRVTGIFRTGYYEFDSTLIFVSLEASRRDLVLGEVISGMHLRLRDPFEANRVREELRQLLAESHPSLFPTSWMDEYGTFYVLVGLQKWAFFVILSLIVIVAGFNIISILTMNVTERRREIGILKAMGVTPRAIGRMFTWEGLAIGLSGILAGNMLGLLLCWIQQRYEPIQIPGEVYFISSLPVEMRASDFALVTASTILLCYLFSHFPARDAAAMDPVESIRYE